MEAWNSESRMKTIESRGARLTREAWLQYALQVLRLEGLQGMRIDRMASDLGVTKGSFYWHFEDLKDLQGSVMKHWRDRYNNIIIENREFLDAEPAVGLLSAVTRIREEGLDEYEVAIRNWAFHDPYVEEVVRKVYGERKTFVRSFFTRLGFRGMDAEIRTRLTLCYMSWEPSIYQEDSKSQRVKMLKSVHELLTKKQ
jgi:AcrR family transcriptional regulator